MTLYQYSLWSQTDTIMISGSKFRAFSLQHGIADGADIS